MSDYRTSRSGYLKTLEALESRRLLSVGGTVDPFFGDHGTASAAVGQTPDAFFTYPQGIHVDPQGRTEVISSIQTYPDQFRIITTLDLTRFLRNGQLDTSFGTGGTISLAPLTNAEQFYFTPDNKLVI